MLTKTDEIYLTQGTMQQLLCLLGSKCFCEKFARDIEYEDALPAVGYLNKAVDYIEKAYDIVTKGITSSQIERLKRYNECHRLALVDSYDPVLSKTPMIMDWEQVRVMVGILNDEVCTICGKSKDEVRKCPLRRTVYDMGGEPDMSKAKINEWCEISRGIK